MIVPLFVGRKSSINALNKALAGKDRLLVLTAQKESATEHPRKEDLFTMGTLVSILRVLKLPDGRVKILVQGVGRAQIESFTQIRPFFKVKIRPIQDHSDNKERSLRKEALMRNIREQLEKIAEQKKAISEHISVLEDQLLNAKGIVDKFTQEKSVIGLRLTPIKDQEKVVEESIAEVERREATANNEERRSLEEHRWQLEDERKKLESKKWEIEKEVEEIENSIQKAEITRTEISDKKTAELARLANLEKQEERIK